MRHFEQGWLDSLCGIYALVNADRIINKTNDDGSQYIFDGIIDYLSKKKILKETILGGVNHKTMLDIMNNVLDGRFLWKTTRNDFRSVSMWWGYAQTFLFETPSSALILSVGGRENHLTVVSEMSDKKMYLVDSSKITTILKSACKMQGYKKENKYVIYPTQSFLCWKIGY